MEKLKCKRCEHEWVKRTKTPVCCPRCKSPYWNKDKLLKIKQGP